MPREQENGEYRYGVCVRLGKFEEIPRQFFDFPQKIFNEPVLIRELPGGFSED